MSLELTDIVAKVFLHDQSRNLLAATFEKICGGHLIWCGDFCDGFEAISIGDFGLFYRLAGKIVSRILGLLQNIGQKQPSPYRATLVRNF
jgi:hypothetical protein